MKIKLTLIGVREWEKHNDKTDEDIHCYFYSGFNEKNEPMEFKSNKAGYKINEVIKYDENLAQEFDLKSTFDSFKGKIKLSEIEA